jgi:hypothetical protein
MNYFKGFVLLASTASTNGSAVSPVTGQAAAVTDDPKTIAGETGTTSSIDPASATSAPAINRETATESKGPGPAIDSVEEIVVTAGSSSRLPSIH